MKLFSIRFKPLVITDIQDAYDWYEEKQPGLGEAFINSLDNCFEMIECNPKLFPIVYKESRRVLMQKFPYGIYYNIEENIIIIMAIFHLKRNPVTVRKRMI